MRRSGLRVITLAAISVLVLSACNSTVPSPSQAPSTATPAPSASASPSAATEAVTIRWFVGLDLGTQSAQIDAEKAFVANYNSTNKDGITIKLEVVPTMAAADVLKNEMAAGNAPDIVGPVGVGGLNGFEGLFLDLTSAIKNANIDLTAYDPALVKFLQLGDQGQIGLPYMIFPGYIWYDKDIFTKANLPNLPTKVGDQYQGQTWDWNELGKIAAQLTVDKSGKKSTDTGFDPKSIVRYGLDFQWNDLRRMASCFGGGSFLGAGDQAQVPAAWADAASWYYSGIWGKTPFIPSGLAESSALLGQGNAQASGNVAMNVAWASSIPSIAADAKSSKVKTWDIAVMPSWKGNTTSPLYADTFTITRASKNPDAAFKAMVAIMADQTLLKAYGGEPAKTADQQAYFDAFDSTLASIFPASRSAGRCWARCRSTRPFRASRRTCRTSRRPRRTTRPSWPGSSSTPGLDVIAELTKLQATLQPDFDAVKPLLSQ